MTCCDSCSRSWLRLTNAFLLLGSFVSLGIGSIAMTEYSTKLHLAQYEWASPLLITAGGFMMVVSCMGYCGAGSCGRGPLFAYFLVQLILLCALIGAGAACFALQNPDAITAAIDKECNITPRPNWCGTPEDVASVENAIKANLGAITTGAWVVAALLFVNACAAFITASAPVDMRSREIAMTRPLNAV
eukprot:TRINITY_DN49932_c0_g1_i1.p1 TRINITY_DN49932_c0_g1~~TRINITY_DN49932_c0_g1_i1.p1  ORF type:complete len:189 (-),score=24.61 TRINITY_DN49932_c0_g1_i1:385-951(-)